jgi:nicotinate-nucleotide--dimethylbenzimidazole phosphoribosyltransferase
MERKRRAVRAAVDRERPRLDADPEATIAAVGGLEIAAMAGFFHRSEELGLTVVLDGFIATAAALVADRLWPGTRSHLIAAHRSVGPGHAAPLRHLGLTPYLDGWGLRLGEGTGALLLMPLLDAAVAVCRMASLADVTGGLE